VEATHVQDVLVGTKPDDDNGDEEEEEEDDNGSLRCFFRDSSFLNLKRERQCGQAGIASTSLSE